MAGFRFATPRYAETIGMRLLQWRFLTEGDRFNTQFVAVVNQRFAERAWPGQNPLGKRVALYQTPETVGPWRTVVGVAGDMRHDGPAAPPQPEIFLPYEQAGAGQVYLAIRTAGDPAAFARTRRRARRRVAGRSFRR